MYEVSFIKYHTFSHKNKLEMYFRFYTKWRNLIPHGEISGFYIGLVSNCRYLHHRYLLISTLLGKKKEHSLIYLFYIFINRIYFTILISSVITNIPNSMLPIILLESLSLKPPWCYSLWNLLGLSFMYAIHSPIFDELFTNIDSNWTFFYLYICHFLISTSLRLCIFPSDWYKKDFYV